MMFEKRVVRLTSSMKRHSDCWVLIIALHGALYMQHQVWDANTDQSHLQQHVAAPHRAVMTAVLLVGRGKR
jgi:hypothetical protein